MPKEITEPVEWSAELDMLYDLFQGIRQIADELEDRRRGQDAEDAAPSADASSLNEDGTEAPG
jgi:hypothetical protein